MDDVEAAEAAGILTALWTLGTKVSIPFSDGLLDRALETTAPVLPEVLSSQMTFADGPDGPRCAELPAIVRAGRRTGLFADHPMAPDCGVLAMTDAEAAEILAGFGVDAAEGKRIGRSLFDETVRRTARYAEAEDDVEDAPSVPFGI